jgi:lambda repressor-like predicted transcriptional regulator
MTEAAAERRAATTEWETLRTLCRRQGRLMYWLAQQAGMAQKTLYNKVNGAPGYIWRPGEKETIASLLGVAVTEIWPDEQLSADGPEPESGEVA